MRPAQLFALVVGVAYLLLGVGGFFVTGLGGLTQNNPIGGGFADNGPHALLIFDLNPFHNVVHLAIGAILVVAALGSLSVTQGMLIGGGLVYILAALLGFIYTLPILSIDDNLAADNWLHLVSGALALGVGFLAAREGPGPMGAT